MKRIILIIAIILVSTAASIVFPNLMKAMNRSRQARAMADIRAIATAWEARAAEKKSYSVGVEQHISAADLEAALAPTYIKHMPHVDGWGTPYQFVASDFDDAGRAQSYGIRSLGSDGRPDRARVPKGATISFADDVIYSNGAFTQFPEGAG
jgi:type II secretory pathway pseudopilin PulG